MDFGTLTSFETGSVELLEFSWPPAAEDQAPQVCLAYVIMKRPSGFLLCVPDGFLSQTELEQGQQAGEEGPVPALIVDLAAHLADQLSPADMSADDLVCFRPASPSVFPLASEVLRQAKEWLQTDGTLPADRSGYHTAVPPNRAKTAKPKRPTMAQLATQQAKVMEVVAAVVDRLDSIVAQGGKAPSPEPVPSPQPALPHPVLGQPLAQAVLPPFQSVPKNLAATLGPPPHTRQMPPAAPEQVDLEEKGQQGLQTGELQGAGQDASLASAVLAQSQALVALVTQLSGSADPLLEVSFLRYLERHGGYSAQPLLGLVAWQVAQALDLMAIGATDGAKDCLSLLLLMLDQTAHDRGNSSLGWLLTLQADPPSNLFAAQTPVPGSNLQSFSPLAEQRWITTALAYAKELETIASRITESQPKQGPPKPPAKPPAPLLVSTSVEEAPLSKKQLRAAQWAARKAPEVPARPSPDGCGPDNDRADVFPLQGQVFSEAGNTQLSRSARATFRDDVARCTSLSPIQAQVYARLSEVVVFLHDQGFEASGYPASAVPPAGFVPHATGGPEALNPYRNILADQVVLHGRGSWNLAAHLGPDLYLPYVEPDCFRFPGTGGPCATFQGESKAELFKMVLLWDARGLLGLTAGPLPDRLLTRVFGAYKAPGKQRQIGDRRGQNSWESRLVGPSKWLPTGPLLCRIHVPLGCCLVGSVTDRRDFYTQASISPQRASTNIVGPALPLEWFAGTAAEARFRQRPKDHCTDPALYADQIDFRRPSLLASGRRLVHPTFHALFQGDAGGVEFATAGHQGLLESSGCLLGPGRLQASHPVSATGPWQGLIIDDFFALAVQPGSFRSGSPSPSSALVDLAKAGYARESVLGSDDKDVRDQRHFKVAGAEIDASEPTVAAGMTLCGYPVVKRMALAAASVRAAQCPALSEELVSTEAASSSPGSDLKPLSRATASELQLLAVLAPVAVSNLAAEPSPQVFASDASMEKGAVCSTKVAPEVALQMWLASDFKGAAVRFDFLDVGEPSPLRGEAKVVPLLPRFVPRGFGPVAKANRVASTCFTVLLAAARFREEVVEAKRVGSPEVADGRVLSCGLPPVRPNAAPAEAPRTPGFESILVNDLLQVARKATALGGDRKVVLLLDSAVGRGAIAKGRSSSRLLRPALLKMSATLVAGGIYLGMSHAPTRLNVADDPSRDVPLRPPAGQCLCEVLLGADLVLASGCVGHSAQTAGWLRLSLLLSLRHDKDKQRQRQRAATPLPEGRPVLQRTAQNRNSLLASFEAWLQKAGHAAKAYYEWPAEEVARALARYGRELFDAGLPYWHLSETINAVSSKRPAIRRQLQGAWDVAFAWMALEPHTHHVAMPAVVLLAVLAVSLLWGWKQEAGLFGLAWGALLRIGEATGALREALVLPRDVLYTQAFALLKIEEPKTRFKVARHQAAKLEAADLVALVDMAFGKLPKGSKLWPYSAQTLRRRLDAILEALWIPTSRTSRRPLDLGSFRPGGATYLLQSTEDSELVRRRGRWVSQKVMEVYLQEVAASTFYPSLADATERRVMDAAVAFPSLLQQAIRWTQGNIPAGSWYYLWSLQSVAARTGDRWAHGRNGSAYAPGSVAKTLR
ncbi:unnamed protein product, partial [Symbiodinium necroappetens]